MLLYITVTLEIATHLEFLVLDLLLENPHNFCYILGGVLQILCTIGHLPVPVHHASYVGACHFQILPYLVEIEQYDAHHQHTNEGAGNGSYGNTIRTLPSLVLEICVDIIQR